MLVLSRLSKLEFGQLAVVDRGGAFEFGQAGGQGSTATINVNDHRFYREDVMGGGLGAAESYIRGDWDSPDLTAAMRVLAQNSDVLAGVEKGAARLLRPLRAAATLTTVPKVLPTMRRQRKKLWSTSRAPSST